MLLDGQAAWALEALDFKGLAAEGGKDVVFPELDERFPAKMTADRMGEAMEEAFGLSIMTKREHGGFHKWSEAVFHLKMASTFRRWLQDA